MKITWEMSVKSILSSEELEHLIKITRNLYVTGGKNETPTMLDKPYQISSDGRISMLWTPDATVRTLNTEDWVRWKFADSMFEAEQDIIAKTLFDPETATEIRIIIWVNEEI